MNFSFLATFIVLASSLSFPQVQPTGSEIETQKSPTSPGNTLPSGIEPGRLIEKLEPEYPSKARDKQIEGSVVLDVGIARNGKVKDVQVISGDPILAHAAVSAVRHWRYTPFSSQGQPVETRTKVTLNFALSSPAVLCPGQQLTEYASVLDSLSKETVSAGKKYPNVTAAENAPVRVYTASDRVKPPHPLYTPDPGYDEAARKAGVQGTSSLRIIVTPEGRVASVKVDRSLGSGLDQKAEETVCQWKFHPAEKDGEPVAVQIHVEVSFRLY